MAKRTPAVACSAENCGDLFPKCGKTTTYSYWKCRCLACREAHRNDARKYSRENPVEVASRKLEYREKNREAIALKRRQDYLARREEEIARTRRYQAKNREKVSEYNRRWSEANRQNRREYNRRWRAENTELARTRRQRRRALLIEAFVEDVNPVVVFERDGHICAHCGIKCQDHTYPALDYATHDHIIPLSWGVSRGGFHSYANSQTLCFSCNSRKGNRNNK